MPRLFALTSAAPLSVRVRSRECCTYLYRVIQFVGWLPPRRGTKRYVYLIWSCLAFGFSTFYLVVGFAVSLVMDFKKFTPGEFLSVFPVFLNVIGLMVKNIMGIVLLKRLNDTELILDVLDEQLQRESDRRKIHKAVANCNFVFTVYGRLYLGYTLSVFLTGVFNGQPPWLIYNPLFDWRDSFTHLWMQTILEYIIMFLMASIELIVDACPVIFLIIFRAHVDVLKDHIRQLRSNAYKTEDENYRDLVCCILDHKSIIKCCNLMRPFMSLTIFIQFLLIGIVLGVTMINIMYFLDIMHSISSIVYLAGILVESFPFCYLCDLLVEDCDDLCNLLGQSNWIDAEPRYKSTLRIFMHNLQQPIIFVAGGIFLISMSTNIKMAKFAFSVMTVVQQMNLAERFK
ncbi:odorant receptor 59b-like [Drosophila sulfurigaster albostrigata]|uniref:odorant receptor 59b-like n=1 Tax=Drosophila sulfurigaster albostrigata TaxID=89887 RepID=UPI002D21AB05|nr:odorant receptor 59b-like [Drosophila sulfurigaster albostrigata]